MHLLDDVELLSTYATQRSDEAFAALVERHVSLVYSSALRQVRDPHLAGEITQAVFIILARKADSLKKETVLVGWLCRTAHFVTRNALKSEHRRQHREHEAHMESLLHETEPEVWAQIAPMLDKAVAELNAADRNAIVLRYYQQKPLEEVGKALGVNAGAAQMRVTRALEKLQRFFSKRGVDSTADAITSAITGNSIQVAPVALAKTVTAVVIAKGAAASGSTLTLVKSTLKLMAWAKAQTAIIASVVILLVAGTAVTVKEVQDYYNNDLWDTGITDTKTLANAPHIVRIIPTKFPNRGFSTTDNDRIYGVGNPLRTIVQAAYGAGDINTIYLTALPPGQFDFIANLPSGSNEALRRKIKIQFGIVGRFTTLQTNVLFLKVQSPNAPGLKPSATRNKSSETTGTAAAFPAAGTVASQPPPQKAPSKGPVYSLNIVGYRNASVPQSDQFQETNRVISTLAVFLEGQLKIPVMDQTKLTNHFDIDLHWDKNDPQHEHLKQNLIDQLGLELVPTNIPIEMLVVEKVK